MSDHLLQQPTIPGRANGIVNLDPPTVQCRECGYVAIGERLALTVILSGITFCPVDGVRRCRGCRAEHRKSCERCGRAS